MIHPLRYAVKNVPKKDRTARLTREEWLQAALDLLAREGDSRITIDALARGLGVSKGSFYWHFESRADFVRSLAAHWSRRYTADISEQVRSAPGDPKSRLLLLSEGIIREDLARYDLAVRAWAGHDPAVAAIVRNVDEQRMTIVRELFAELGFRGAELAMRTRTFVAYHSFEQSLLSPQRKRTRLAERKRRIEMLIRP
ncbi:MAG: TetR/AcrR family transcriptional regulator [Planctomycetota bacterium]|jgi:AcrR family transcriptional regulator